MTANDSVWLLQPFSKLNGKPWFALQCCDDAGVSRCFYGFHSEMTRIARKLGIKPEELPAITEAEFFSRVLD